MKTTSDKKEKASALQKHNHCKTCITQHLLTEKNYCLFYNRLNLHCS